MDAVFHNFLYILVRSERERKGFDLWLSKSEIRDSIISATRKASFMEVIHDCLKPTEINKISCNAAQ